MYSLNCLGSTVIWPSGGHDRGRRALRYLEWSWDPDPEDTTYLTTMVYALTRLDASL